MYSSSTQSNTKTDANNKKPMTQSITEQKRNIVEQNVDRYFTHLWIYNFVRYLFKRHGFKIKLIWLIFLVASIAIVMFDLNNPTFLWIVAAWFILWVAMILLAGIDRIIIDASIWKVYRSSQKSCLAVLDEDLTEQQFKIFLTDILDHP